MEKKRRILRPLLIGLAILWFGWWLAVGLIGWLRIRGIDARTAMRRYDFPTLATLRRGRAQVVDAVTYGIAYPLILAAIALAAWLIWRATRRR